MGLKRMLARKTLKERGATLENYAKQLNFNQKKTDNEINFYRERLQMLEDIILSMVITDIRNHNYSETDTKKQVSLSFAYVKSVTENYTLDMDIKDNILVITPKEKYNKTEEGNTNDETEKGNDFRVAKRGENSEK